MGAQLKKQTQKANRSIMNNTPSINYRRKAPFISNAFRAH